MVRLSFSLASRKIMIGACKADSDQQRASFSYKSRLKPLDLIFFFFDKVFMAYISFKIQLSVCILKTHLFMSHMDPVIGCLSYGVRRRGTVVCTFFQAPWAQETSLGSLPNPCLGTRNKHLPRIQESGICMWRGTACWFGRTGTASLT